MNVDSMTNPKVQESTANQTKTQVQNDPQVKFSDELKELKKSDESQELKNTKQKQEEEKNTDLKVSKEKDSQESKNDKNVKSSQQKESDEENLYANKLLGQGKQNDSIDNAVKNLSEIVKELSQSDEKDGEQLKNIRTLTDEKHRGEELINNDFSIQDSQDKLPQMMPNMNFSGDGQPFVSFMNDSQFQKGDKLSLNQKDLAEEAEVLSTMAENIAMANRLNIEKESAEQVVIKNDGIKKVDTNTGLVKETIAKFDTVVMNEADVEVFANLVQNGEANLNSLAPEAAQKSVHVSKTLADMLAKSMEDNKPIRIEFDNDISVIIRVSRDGKLSADFLPSSQIAEAYLRENLPLLRQRFDDKNLEYNELNQRERQDRNKERQNKRGRNDE